MSVDFSPSVNIVRDIDRSLNYIPTENSRRIYTQILNDYALGIHAFTVIGSYGTGKSAFLLAFERTLTGQHQFFPLPNGQFNGAVVFDSSMLLERLTHLNIRSVRAGHL